MLIRKPLLFMVSLVVVTAGVGSAVVMSTSKPNHPDLTTEVAATAGSICQAVSKLASFATDVVKVHKADDDGGQENGLAGFEASIMVHPEVIDGARPGYVYVELSFSDEQAVLFAIPSQSGEEWEGYNVKMLGGPYLDGTSSFKVPFDGNDGSHEFSIIVTISELGIIHSIATRVDVAVSDEAYRKLGLTAVPGTGTVPLADLC